MTGSHSELEEICFDCRQPLVLTKVGKGKKAQRIVTCDCIQAPPVESATMPKKRAVKNTAAKGGLGEREVCNLLTELGFDAYRTAGSGAHGSRNNELSQDTDIVWRFRKDGNEVFRARIESKLMKRVPGLLSLVTLLSRSQWLRVRQDREKAFWFVPEDQLKIILAYAKQGMEQ